MTELETLLLRQLEQQQRDSEALMNGLSAQFQRLQTALNAQQSENDTLRREMEQSDQRTSAAFDRLTLQFEELMPHLESLDRQLKR